MLATDFFSLFSAARVVQDVEKRSGAFVSEIIEKNRGKLTYRMSINGIKRVTKYYNIINFGLARSRRFSSCASELTEFEGVLRYEEINHWENLKWRSL